MLLAEKPETEIKLQSRTFPAGITGDYILFCVLVILASAFCFLLAGTLEHYFPGKGNFLLLLGLAGILLPPLLFLSFKQEITVNPQEIIYRDGRDMITIPWNELSEFQAPRPLQKIFRVAYLGNGKQNFTLKSFYLPKFEVLLSIIILARKRKYLREDVYIV